MKESAGGPGRSVFAPGPLFPRQGLPTAVWHVTRVLALLV